MGAASLGARRDAPPERRAPSARSDERPLATQGDMLNSIKFQRRFRDTITTERFTNKLKDNQSTTSKDKPSIRIINSKTSDTSKQYNDRLNNSRQVTSADTTRGFFRAPRPASPKGRRSPYPSVY